MAWLHDLKPLSPFLSKISRDDLGEASNTMFRECITWTEFVPLDEQHLQRLKDSDGYGNMGVRPDRCKNGPQILINKESTDFKQVVIFDHRLKMTNFSNRGFALGRIGFPNDPVLSGEFGGNKGALIFCFYKRTVETSGAS